VLIWTKVAADGPTEVEWEVGLDPEAKNVVQRGRATATPRSRYIVTVDVGGLDPDTTYYYRFSALGSLSIVGRTRTAPAESPQSLRFAVAACAKYQAGYFNAYGRIAERDDLNFVLHLGDYAYQMGADDRDPAEGIGRGLNSGASVSLQDYHDRLSLYRRDVDLQRLHQMHPVIAILDDNDVCNGTWRDGAEKHDTSAEGDWGRRKAAAIRAWRQWVPNRTRGPRQMHRTMRFGDLADLIILDERTHRDEMIKGPEMYRAGRTMLGADQYRWFLRELSNSRAIWRLIANPVMIGQCHTDLSPSEVGFPLGELGVLTKEVYGPDPDQWDGYPHERDQIFEQVRRRGIKDLVFLSGDVHSSWAVELKRRAEAPDEEPVGVEFVTTSLTSQNLDERMKTPARTSSLEIERVVDEANPHIHWMELDSHGYLVVDVDADRVLTEWHFVSDVLHRTSEERIGARWLVRRGEPRLIRA
jgi:alkaline phosphatase D